MLQIKNIEVIYNKVIPVLRGISLEVAPGQVVAVLGPNGAGKSTLLKAISGLLRSELGDVTRGSILWQGQPIHNRWAEEIVREGIVQVIEGRRIFQHLTVEGNLLVGAMGHEGGRRSVKHDLERVYTYFPRLKEFRKRTSGYLSGGEGQMLVIGRALMARPRLLMLDEPSLGLAPLLVREIFEIVREINKNEHVSILLVEQNVRAALSLVDHGYVMESGRIVLDGSAEQLAVNEDIKEFYLGLTQMGERKSYRDVKHYRRRKRWLG